LLTLNVPIRIGKRTPRGTCTPGWEPLVYHDRNSEYKQAKSHAIFYIKLSQVVELKVPFQLLILVHEKRSC